jgi:hypothetical protein
MKLRYKHQCTKAYWAGMVTAKAHNLYYAQTLPSIIECMSNCSHLGVILNEYYRRMRVSSKTKELIYIYEQFTFQPGRPTKYQGGIKEFMIGYTDGTKVSKIDQEDLNYLYAIGVIEKKGNP